MKHIDVIAKLNNTTIASMLVVVYNFILIFAKLAVASVSGSVSIFSEAIHSGVDLLASCVTFLCIRIAGKPANESYPFGYGKIENVSALFEGILLFVAFFTIIKEAIPQIMSPKEFTEIPLMMSVMLTASIMNILISMQLTKVAKKNNSEALAADAVHLKTDAFTAFGIGVSVGLIKLTGFYIIEPILGIIVGLFIVKEAYYLSKNAIMQLLDVRLSPEEHSIIQGVLDNFHDSIIDYHGIKTRRAGNLRFVSFHISLDENLTVKESHALEEIIESELQTAISNLIIDIHIDPV